MTPDATSPTAGQRLAVDQLHDLAAEGDAVEVVATADAAGPTGFVPAEIALDCSGTPHASRGITLRARERFTVWVPQLFPFCPPAVQVSHTRWAGTPHVQWGSVLCLYVAPSTEWVPADGMRGLVERLALWLDRASLGQLDPDDQPLHPPVAYPSATAGLVVLRADLGDLAPPATMVRRHAGTSLVGPHTGELQHQHRLLAGVCEWRGADRLDVVDWCTRHEWLRRCLAGELDRTAAGYPVVGALVVLTDGEMAFEYPSRVAQLMNGLEELGVGRADFLDALAEITAANHYLASRRGDAGAGSPLNVLVGTPSRRGGTAPLRQHLVCWQIDNIGRRIAEGLLWSGSQDEIRAELGRRIRALSAEWLAAAEAAWASVMEARPEVTARRDTGSAAEWLAGRRVLILGCGALGAPIADCCVRAGVSQVTVVDNGVVTPGILVRQPYADTDIGTAKALALANRLNTVRHDQPVVPLVGSALEITLSEQLTPPNVDLVIDATADAAVASLLELRRSAARSAWPPVLSVVVGHDARRGVVTVAKPNATGAGRDILRRLTLVSRAQHAARLQDVADDIFPTDTRTELFQPEPGCSSPTFTGSAAELTALAGQLLDAGIRALAGPDAREAGLPMAAAIVRLDTSLSLGPRVAGLDWLGWPNDDTVADQADGYEVRISRVARSQLRTECRRGARLRGKPVETGGLLIGRIDDACKCIWVDDASGPPPDSRLSAFHFEHGIQGVPELIDYYRRRSRMAATYLGMWHCHPSGETAPSRTDRASMHALVGAAVGGPPRALILIIGGEPERWNAWLDRGDRPEVFTQLISRRSLPADVAAPPPIPAAHEGSSWPGGWATQRTRRLDGGLLARLRRRLRRRR